MDEERNYTIEELEQAILDLLDGEDPNDIHIMTGLEMDRCMDLCDLFEEVWAWNYLHGRPSDQK